MSKPLKDILVVAVEQAVAEPYCTSRLADAGARVIDFEHEFIVHLQQHPRLKLRIRQRFGHQDHRAFDDVRR